VRSRARPHTERERERTRCPNERTDHHQSRHAKQANTARRNSFRDRIATVRDAPRTYAELIELKMDQYVVVCAGCNSHAKNGAKSGLENLKLPAGEFKDRSPTHELDTQMWCSGEYIYK